MLSTFIYVHEISILFYCQATEWNWIIRHLLQKKYSLCFDSTCSIMTLYKFICWGPIINAQKDLQLLDLSQAHHTIHYPFLNYLPWCKNQIMIRLIFSFTMFFIHSCNLWTWSIITKDDAIDNIDKTSGVLWL